MFSETRLMIELFIDFNLKATKFLIPNSAVKNNI